MARINRIAYEGVQGRDLSRHLRANGCRVSVDEQTGILTTRSDKTIEQLRQLATQLPGCLVVIDPVNHR